MLQNVQYQKNMGGREKGLKRGVMWHSDMEEEMGKYGDFNWGGGNRKH